MNENETKSQTFYTQERQKGLLVVLMQLGWKTKIFSGPHLTSLALVQ